MKRSTSSQSALIFLHISKTGGTTLRSIIQKQYPPDVTYDLDPSYFVSESEQYPIAIKERLAKLKAMPDEEKSKFRCFFHPTAYGLHELLPQQSAYITMLRDPLDHYISSYYYGVNMPDHSMHDKIVRNNISLEDHIDRYPTDNLQTRRLSGHEPLSALSAVEYPLPSDALQQAQHNLQHGIAVIGLMERYDESVLLMKQHFGWKRTQYVPKNVAPRRKAVSELSSETRHKLEKQLEQDLELYEFAKKLFQEQIDLAGDKFEGELRAFQATNRQYAKVISYRRKLRHQLRIFRRFLPYKIVQA